MEFSEENLEFWIACEDYKQQKSAKLEVRANKIFTDFVAVQAPREVSYHSFDMRNIMVVFQVVDLFLELISIYYYIWENIIKSAGLVF